MHYRPFFAGLSVGLLLCLSGCYHYAHSPYAAPYGTYPSTPNGGYVVPNTPNTPYVPNTSPPGATPTPITPNWGPPGGSPPPNNSAPPYNPTPGGSNNGMVPEPIDDKPFGGTPPGASLTPNIEPIPVGSIPAPNPSGIELQPIEALPPTSPGGTTASLNQGDERFEPPTTGSAASVPARPVTMSQSQDPKRRPYGYETRNYSWLRGFVDYDPLDNRWVMIYSAPPNPKDRYGGTFTLADHPSFRNITPGSHLYVQGAIDETSLDQHGKPLYQIEKVQLLAE